MKSAERCRPVVHHPTVHCLQLCRDAAVQALRQTTLPPGVKHSPFLLFEPQYRKNINDFMNGLKYLKKKRNAENAAAAAQKRIDAQKRIKEQAAKKAAAKKAARKVKAKIQKKKETTNRGLGKKKEKPPQKLKRNNKPIVKSKKKENKPKKQKKQTEKTKKTKRKNKKEIKYSEKNKKKK
jgi:hypothetical protein